MGKRGPKPLPLEVLALRGSREPRSGFEPQPDRELPAAPAWLAPLALECWLDTLPQLEAMGVATRIDGNALARYCTLYARWREAEAVLARSGASYELHNEDGSLKYVAQRPEVAIAANLATQLAKLEAEFGMTPSSRSRIIVAPSATPQNAILDFLDQAAG